MRIQLFSQFIPTTCARESTQGGSHPSGPTVLGAMGPQRGAHHGGICNTPLGFQGPPSSFRVTGLAPRHPTRPFPNAESCPAGVCGVDTAPCPLFLQHPTAHEPSAGPRGVGREPREPPPRGDVPPTILGGNPPTPPPCDAF